jgi:hypothetical protein
MDRSFSVDRRGLLRLAGLAGVAGVAGLAGCGVASRGGVVVDGAGPSAGTGAARRMSPPLGPENPTKPEIMVENFLSQAAGDPADTKEALQRWKSYMTADLAGNKRWDNESRVTVVWVNPEPVPSEGAVNDRLLTYDMVPLGRLDKNGWLAPTDDPPAKVTFTVTTQRSREVGVDSKQTLFIKAIENAPPGMLLSTNGLAAYFDYRHLYFWDKSGRFLIPDGRYLPGEWTLESAPRQKKMVDWLLAGPAPWLESAVQSLPNDMKISDNPAKGGPNQLVLNFGGMPTGFDLKKLISQLTWTLLPECQVLGGSREVSPIVIKADSVEKKVDNPTYLDDNPAQTKVQAPRSQQAFAIDERRVLRRVRNIGATEDLPIPLLTGEQNRDVEWAAFGLERGSAGAKSIAVVTKDAKDHTGLVVGTGAKLEPIAALAGKRMSQPVFVDEDSLFILANERLYHVRVGTRGAAATNVTATAFSIAPDGRRIAYIHGRRLTVASMVRSSDGTFTINISAARDVPTIFANLYGVAFTAEGWLAVCGTYADQTRVVEISLDGAMVGNPSHAPTLSGWLPGILATADVTSLTASIDGPAGAGPTRRIFVTANGFSRDATSVFSELDNDILGEPRPTKHPTNAFFL